LGRDCGSWKNVYFRALREVLIWVTMKKIKWGGLRDKKRSSGSGFPERTGERKRLERRLRLGE